MSWEKTVTVLAGLAIGASLSGVMVAAPASEGIVTAQAANTGQAYQGTLGTNCTWDLSADGKTLTITGGEGGGTLPDGGYSQFGIIATAIMDQMKAQGNPHWALSLAKVTQITLSGDLKTTANASYLFTRLGSSAGATVNLGSLDTSETTNMAHMFDSMQVTSLDLAADKNFKTDKVTNMAGMFESCAATTINVSSLNTSHVTDMSNMFGGFNLTKLDTSNFDTSHVTNMSGMFASQEHLETTNINHFNTSKVTDMSYMFYLASGLKQAYLNFDTSNVTDMSNMFANNVGDTNLTTIKFGEKFNTHKVESMASMFAGDTELKTVNTSALDTTNVEDMREMFRNTAIESLDLSNFKTDKVTDMNRMLSVMPNLSDLDISSFNTDKVQNFSAMFMQDPKLRQLDLSNFHTDQVVGTPDKGNFFVGLSSMFAGDTGLVSLNIPNFKMTTDSARDLYTFTESMFDQDSQLSKLVLGHDVRFQKDVNSNGKRDPNDPTALPELFDVNLPNILAVPNKYTGAWQAVGAGTEDDPRGSVYKSSDDLVKAYQSDTRPAGVQTYVWQPVNRPVTPPVTPIVPPKPTPDPDEPDEVFKGSSLNATKKIGFYRRPTFTDKNRITWFAKAPRTRQPQFVVIGKATSKHGVARYRVRDVNRHSQTYRLTGYVTTRAAYVEPTYVSKDSRAKRITVINPQGINGYGQANLTQKRKHYRQGQQLQVKRLVTHNLTTRFQLTNGQYVTGNQQWIQTGRHAYPRRIKTTHTIWRYRDVNLQKKTRHYRRHQQLRVLGWDYSDHGTLRYRIAGGYITANTKYVVAVK